MKILLEEYTNHTGHGNFWCEDCHKQVPVGWIHTHDINEAKAVIESKKWGKEVDKEEMVFVYGSNEAGIHGAGAARMALEKHGAIYGVGIGLQGNSYGVPTKDMNIETLPFDTVADYVEIFLGFAERNKNLKFKITRVGCGLAGFKDEEIAHLFKFAPSNCFFDEAWKLYLGDDFRYWGSF